MKSHAPRVVGIDLGTTYSLIAYFDGEKAAVIPDESGRNLLPSAVSLGEKNQLIIGWEARHRRVSHPLTTVTSVKRLMGRGAHDIDPRFFAYPLLQDDFKILRIRLGEVIFTPPEISAAILKKLKTQAESFLGESVTKTVITVPAYFNDAQRQATKDAGKIAGWDVLRIINEPTAAALAYGFHKKKQGILAIYDLGGGTFDVSILKLKEGIFEVLSTNGNTLLGGDDIDRSMTEFFLREIKERFHVDLAEDLEACQTLMDESEKVKCRLSSEEETEMVVHLPWRNFKWNRRITRSEFDGMIGDIVDKTLAPCRQAMLDASLGPDQIDEVILVGGATRTLLVRKKVEELFRKVPRCELNPDEVVAMGAAIQADILSGKIKDMLLLDVTPLSLGIETFGGVMGKIIDRNTRVPARASEVFTTFVDGQTSVEIHVLQGERELAKDNRSLGRFQLRGISPMPAGLPRIEVTFLIDENGILNVQARDLRTGKEQSIAIKPSYGLTEEEVHRMVKESIDYAESDVTARLLIDARNQAGFLIHAVEKALDQGGALIPKEEQEGIQKVLKDLKSSVQGNDHRLILDRMEQLETLTRHLAEVLIDSTLKDTLVSRKTTDFS